MPYKVKITVHAVTKNKCPQGFKEGEISWQGMVVACFCRLEAVGEVPRA